MYLSFDAENGSVYVSLIPEEAGFIPRREVTLEDVEDLGEGADDISLDVDEEGRLVGIEVRSPELFLRAETLAHLRNG